jgi:hypothetical protein
MSAQVIPLDFAREARRRDAILAEVAAFWGCDKASLVLTSEPAADGRTWHARVTGPGGRRLVATDHPTREHAEAATRPSIALSIALCRLPITDALDAIERALVAHAIQVPQPQREALLGLARDVAELNAPHLAPDGA